MRYVPVLLGLAGVLVTSLLLPPIPALADDRIRVEIPEDPFVPAFPERAEIEELRRAMGTEHYRAVARLVRAMDTAIAEFNARARAHRTRALTLRKDVDAYIEDRRIYAEDDARFRAACQPPPSKAAVADCRTWAAKLERTLAALKVRKSDLTGRATALERELEEGLMAGLRRLRVESVTATRDALQAKVTALRQRTGALTEVRGAVTRRIGASSDTLQRGDPSVAGAYRTGPDGSCVVTLPQGQKIIVAPGSTLDLYDEADTEHQGLLGRLHEGVTRFLMRGIQPREARAVLARKAHCGVRGTEFILDAARTGDVLVTVLDGHVTVTPARGSPPVELAAAQRLAIGAEGAAKPVEQVDPAAIERWWQARMTDVEAQAPGTADGEDTGKGDAAVPPLVLIGAALLLLVLVGRALTRRGGAR